MAYLILHERLTAVDVSFLFVALIAATIIVQGQVKEAGASTDIVEIDHDSFVYKLCLAGLIFNPVLTSIGKIAMRQMRKMNPLVLTFYLNGGVMVCGILGAFIAGDDLVAMWKNFDLRTWCLIAAIVLSSIASQVTKFAAVQKDKASALAVYTFLPIVFQFIVDATLFNIRYSRQQQVGLLILASLYVVMVVRVCTVKE